MYKGSMAWGLYHQRRESITVTGHGRESEGAIVAMKRGNSRGAKDPCRIDAFVRRKEYRLGKPDYGIQCSEQSRRLGHRPSRPGPPIGYLISRSGQLPVHACVRDNSVKPDAGNPHVRFDEGGGGRRLSPRYSTVISG